MHAVPWRFRLRLGRGHAVLAAIWLLGLTSLAAVLVLQGRLDERRRAQIAVSSLRVQVSGLPKMALGLNGPHTRAQVQADLEAAERRIAATARSLDRLGGNHRDSQLIVREERPLFAVLTRANTIARSGRLRTATVTLGLALLPGAPGYRLNRTFDTISAKYDREAASARKLADVGTVFAIVLLLLAFSVVISRASKLAREKQLLLEQSRHDALTDELTGLANRRKLFADLDGLLAHPGAEPALLGILDLDGFKAYNDRLGHPAGDALLARMGRNLKAAVEAGGAAYRMGGDEFCVIAHGAGAEAILERARTTLADNSLGISCSLGSAVIHVDASTAGDLLRQADQRLYEDKRASRAQRPSEAQVFAA
jgi:diguanylate cyclase (GGDEF)-like protein